MREEIFGPVLIIVCSVLMAVAMLWTTHAAMMSQLGPNVAAGIRITSTLRDRNAWIAGHRAAWPVVKWTAVATFALCAVAIVAFVLGHHIPALIIGFLPILLVLASLVPTVRRARAAAEAAPPGDDLS